MKTRKDFGKTIMRIMFSSDYYGFTPNIRFTIKCLIMKNPGTTVMLSLIVSTFIFSY
jgi:hypothetical protein